MAIKIAGTSGYVAEVDGTTYRTLRVTVRPVNYGALGSYRVSMSSGTIPNGQGVVDCFQARWVTTAYALIWGLTMNGFTPMNGGVFGLGVMTGLVYVSRSWTVDGSGGTSADLTNNNNKLRSSMASSQMGAVRIVSPGSNLSQGTKTNDAQPFGSWSAPGIGLDLPYYYIPLSIVALYGSTSLESQGNPAPIVLAQNEGITTQMNVTAGSDFTIGFTMAWSEVAAY